MMNTQYRYEAFFKKIAKNLGTGSLVVSTPGAKTLEYHGSIPGPRADMIIKDWNIIKDVIKQGEVGFLKAYQMGLLETSNLANLIIIGILNEMPFKEFFDLSGIKKYIYRLYTSFIRRNSMKGSRDNIRAHYDLSNDFFSLWLDPSMCYSSGIFSAHKATTLGEAQHQKITRVLDQLDLPKGSHILEIGCGWGAFLLEAAKRGYKATGVTISEKQFYHTKEIIESSAFKDQLDVQFLDYRKIKGQYDAIVSIEMFEAVGEEYWPNYFSAVSTCLNPGGKAIIQTISIHDDHFEAYRKAPGFIQLYIFPGGMLPSPQKFMEGARQVGLSVLDNFTFGHDYARTLHEWLDRFDSVRDKVIQLGFDEAFIKLWRFYLSYCIAGFTAKRTDVHQFTLQKGP
jgi:cyclopropane-fatty-acyl-phospholipid synthase